MMLVTLSHTGLRSSSSFFSCILSSIFFTTICLIGLQILAVIYPNSASLHTQISLYMDRYETGLLIQRC